MKPFTRRDMIETSALALLGFQLGCLDSARESGTLTSHSNKPLTVVETLTARGLGAERKAIVAAQKTGSAWLKGKDDPPSARTLFDSFFADVPEQTSNYAAWVRLRHQRDLEDNRLEEVAGWSISQTEAHLFALLALTAPGR